MTELTKPLTRKTTARVFSKGQKRPVLLTMIPPARIGVRLAGTRDTYQIDAEAIFSIAVKMHVAEIEKLAKRIAKNEGIRIKSATAKARRELAAKLKI